MPVTPIQRLAKALCAATSGGKPFEVAELARAWGIDGRGARRAAAGKAVAPTVYLQLCAALGLDPVSFAAIEPKAVAPVDWNKVGTTIILAFIGTPENPVPEGFTMRAASMQWGIALAPLARMKAGNPASIENFLALCAALNRHPHDFLKLVPVHVSQCPVAEQQQSAAVTP